MTKNIVVVDEQGQNYGVTYPKRAKGLVKNGRARYVDETTICLACPPNHDLEDMNMDEHLNIAGNTEENSSVTSIEPVYSIEYILKQLERIRRIQHISIRPCKISQAVETERWAWDSAI